MNFTILALIAAALMIAAGLLIINRASTSDEAAGGFGLTFFGAVILTFALLVLFASMQRARAGELGHADRAIVVTVCHVEGACREVVATEQAMPACIISPADLADWKEHSRYRGEQWTIGRVRCEGSGYRPREAI